GRGRRERRRISPPKTRKTRKEDEKKNLLFRLPFVSFVVILAGQRRCWSSSRISVRSFSVVFSSGAVAGSSRGRFTALTAFTSRNTQNATMKKSKTACRK